MSADYGPAVFYPLSKFFWANANKPTHIIIHGTAGGSSAKGIGDYYRSLEASGERQSSVHFCIGVTGEVYQFVSVKDAAWGNGVVSAGHAPWWHDNPNNYTISIEHCKPATDNSSPITDAQKASSFALVKFLCGEHGIPARAADATGGVAPHSSIDPVNRARCPGPYPWDELWAYLKGATPVDPMQSPYLEGWHDDGTTLTAPNGIPVTMGFRAFILADPSRLLWNGNVPLEKEWNDNGVSRQLLTLFGLYWDGTGVYYDHVGAQLVEARAQVAPGAQVLTPGIYQVK